MNLIFLHGPPAAGKLTIARELVNRIGGRLFDNHVSIDFAKTLFDFGTPEFWRLVKSVRLMATQQAAESKLDNLICTYCYSDPEDRAHLERLVEIVESRGGRIVPVYLHCDLKTLLDRVGNADRIARSKVASAQMLEDFLADWNISPVDHPACFSIDTSRLTANECAKEIVDHFNLAN